MKLDTLLVLLAQHPPKYSFLAFTFSVYLVNSLAGVILSAVEPNFVQQFGAQGTTYYVSSSTILYSLVIDPHRGTLHSGLHIESSILGLLPPLTLQMVINNVYHLRVQGNDIFLSTVQYV